MSKSFTSSLILTITPSPIQYSTDIEAISSPAELKWRDPSVGVPIWSGVWSILHSLSARKLL